MLLVINHSELLAELNSDKFKELWPAQEYVLSKYSESFVEEEDIAIELPTGAGKTLIALIIAETWRRDGKKVAILSANKTLARQLANEAEQLRIPIVLLEGSRTDISPGDRRDYHRSNKVAVMNYWVYFNQIQRLILPICLLWMTLIWQNIVYTLSGPSR